MNFFASLVHSSDRTVDSLAVAGLAGVVVFLGVTVYSVIQDVHVFSPISYGTGLGTILGALGAGKGARDYLTPMQTTMTSTPSATTMTQRPIEPVHHDV